MLNPIKNIHQHWFALLLLLAGLAIMPLQIFGPRLQFIIGDLGDSRFILSIIEFNYQWICGNYSSYWDGFFMYPDQEVISYSDNLLGITPFYALIRVWTTDPFTSYQLLLILCHALNFLGCYHCFVRSGGTRYGAACGAFIFAFSMALNGIHNHPQYTFRFFIPYFFFYLWRYLQTFSVRNLYLMLFSLCAQIYLGVYFGVFLILGAILFFVAWVYTHGIAALPFKRLARHLGLSFILVPAALFPLILFYLKRILSTGYFAGNFYILQTVPRPASYVKAFPGSLLWDGLKSVSVDAREEWLHYLFPGGLVLLSFILAFIFAYKRRGMHLIVFLTLLLMLLSVLSINGNSVYAWLMHLPGIKTARIVSRIVVVLLFFSGWLICMQVSSIGELRRGVRYGLLLMLPLALVLDNYCQPSAFKRYDKQEARSRSVQIAAKVTAMPGYRDNKVFAYVPGSGGQPQFLHVDAMIAALMLKTKTVNGYSSTCHRHYGPFWRNADVPSLHYWLSRMRRSPDSLLVVY